MKRITAFIMALLILAISFNLTVSATGKTADEAISWVKSQCGKSIDYDGVAGYQCVDLIKAYYNYLGVSPIAGNANTYTNNTLPSGWARYPGGKPQKGDILVYTGGTYGHVAIYESDYSHYHQNYDGKSYVYNVTSHTYNWSGSNYWGCIHPNFASSAPADDNITAFNNSKSAVNKFLYVSLENQKLYTTPSLSGTAASPSVNGKTMSALPVKNTVYADYIGTNANGEKWYHLASTTGAICDQLGGYYVKATALADVKTGAYRVHPDMTVSVKLRSGQSTSNSIVANMPANSKLTVSEISGTWAKASYNGQIGWVMVGYIVWDGVAHTHDWDDGTVTKAATETEKGIKTYTCKVCNEKKTEEIPIISGCIAKISSANTNRGGTVKLIAELSKCPVTIGGSIMFNIPSEFSIVSGEWKVSSAEIKDFDIKQKQGVFAVKESNAQNLNGTVFELTLKVNESAVCKDYSVSVDISLTEKSGNTINVPKTYGTISVNEYVPGDVDGKEGVTSNDAIFLLYHIYFPSQYPIAQPCDFNGDGFENSNDAIYLLYHVYFKDAYPLF